MLAWQEQGEGNEEEEESQASPKSMYSSAWGTSDSEEEVPELRQHLASPRPSVSLDEDNKAKLKEKGASPIQLSTHCQIFVPLIIRIP